MTIRAALRAADPAAPRAADPTALRAADPAALRADALAARATGDHARAADAWRALLDHAPEDPALALELKHDLRAGLHYPDSDPRFRRAARFLPDEAWLDHYAALYAFHGSDLDAIDARACALLARWPGEPRLDAIRGEVARQRRDWPAAERAFRNAARLRPARTDWAAQADEAARYAALAARPWPAEGPAYAVSVVNLDRNPERMVEIERQFAAAQAPWHRIPAIEGSRLPAAAVTRLAGTAAPRGTLGCFLSHAAAWEALLTRGDAAALVVEDDVIPLLDLPATLGGPLRPGGWDLLFVNDRLAPRRLASHRPNPALGTIPLAEAMQAFHPEDNAPGADGYVVTAAAARTLLRWLEADGWAGDVDWRLLAYSLDPAAVAAIPAGHAGRELGRLSAAIPRPERLRARVLTPALIRTVGVSSDREDQNRLHPA